MTRKEVRVLLRGWFGQGNSGDDALFVAVSRALGQASSRLVSSVRVSPEGSLPPLLSPVVFLPFKRRFKGEALLRDIYSVFRADIMVFGGGSTMSDVNRKWFRSLRHIRFVCWLARRRGIPILFVALGLGPLETREGRGLARDILNLADFVEVRDGVSFELCKEIGVTTPVQRGFDPAVLVPGILRTGKPGPRSRRVRIGIALAGCPGSVPNTEREQELKVAGFARAVRALSHGSDLEVVVIQMCANPNYNDLELCEKVIEALGDVCATSLIRYRPDPGAMMAKVASLDAVVAERLHAAVYAYAARIPFAVIPYHGKCRAFAEDVGLPQCCILDPTLSSDKIDGFLRLLPGHAEECRARLPLDAAEKLAREGQAAFVARMREIVQ